MMFQGEQFQDTHTGSIDLVKLQFLIEKGDRIKLKKFGEESSDAPEIHIVNEILSRIFNDVKLLDENVSSIGEFLKFLQKSFFNIISSPEVRIYVFSKF
jgi:hypothetical protein